MILTTRDMSDFYKKFLRDEMRRARSDAARPAYLGAFGKHPGWDDHVEDLGLETESLIFAKTLLYVQGIGGQIDSGAWEKLDPVQQLPAFKHVFLWLRGSQYLVGRLWSSSDGKGRTRYPMVGCAHILGSSLLSALNLALPQLERVEQACLLTDSATEVRSILGRARAELQNTGTTLVESVLRPVTPQQWAEFIASPLFGPNHEGWSRILYQLENQCAAFAPGRFSTKGDPGAVHPQPFRLPSNQGAARGLLLWARFFLSQLDPMVPLLLIAPLEEPWVDATLGEPTPHEFFCLRAGPKALPLVTEVPYSLDDAFRARARGVLDTFQANENSPHPAGPEQTTIFPSSTLSSTKRRVLKWFGGGGNYAP
ncbi:MAG TPA: hypothetical protein VNH84_05145 [Candidatus Saccharimonadales bacterium]|nr:hypothetical protein [Candidatus Saccharimonadales bacterium]